MGMIALSFAVTNWLHPGSDGMSCANLLCQILVLLHFLAIEFGHIYNDKLWDEKKNMWYIQTVVNVFFVTVAYLGFKDSQERAAPAAAAASPAADAPAPAAGSML